MSATVPFTIVLPKCLSAKSDGGACRAAPTFYMYLSSSRFIASVLSVFSQGSPLLPKWP